jgi:tRNA(adenine34) deaminase
MLDEKNDDYWMGLALNEAQYASDLGEIPVGAVIIKDGRLIGRGGNRVETLKDPTAHAEIIAIGAASQESGYERLNGATIYVTLEPCAMCAGAIVLARLGKLVYGAADSKTGACGSIYNICDDKRLNHQVEIISGICEYQCSLIIKKFFKSLRHNKK